MNYKTRLLILFCSFLALLLFYRWQSAPTVVLADIAIGDGNQPVNYGGSSGTEPALKSERYFYTDVVEILTNTSIGTICKPPVGG